MSIVIVCCDMVPFDIKTPEILLIIIPHEFEVKTEEEVELNICNPCG